MKYSLNERAVNRLREIGDYLDDGGFSRYADALDKQFERASKHLCRFPYLGSVYYNRLLPPPPRQFRRLIVAGHSIIYVVVQERDTVLIVDYWHNARDPGRLLEALDALSV